MLLADFARAPILASIPLLHAAGLLSFPLLLGARRAPRLLHAAVLRVAARRSCPSSSARTSDDVAGEQPHRGRRRVRGADRACARRPADPAHRRAERPLRRRRDLRRRLPPRPRVRSRAGSPSSAVRPEACSPGFASSRQDSLLGPIAAIVVALRLPRARGCRPGSRSTRTTSSTGARASPGSSTRLSARARSSGASLAVFAVEKVAPLRLAGLAILAFVVPMWVLPFLPPWPIVFVALFVAMFFTPLINGPFFAVLTSRTPEAAAREGHDRGHLDQHARRPARVPGRGTGARALGRGGPLQHGRRGDDAGCALVLRDRVRFRELDLAPEPAPS